MVLELRREGVELLIRLGKIPGEFGDRLGDPNAGNDVLALCVDEVVTFKIRLACGGVAGHGHAGSGPLPHVAEHHRLHVDGGSEIVCNPVGVAICECAVRVPRMEHGFHRHHQLVVGILGEVLTRLVLDDLLEALQHSRQGGGIEVGVRLDACCGTSFGQDLLERVIVDTHHDASEHLDEAAIGVIDEALIAECLDHAGEDCVVDADVEDGVHHPWHGELGTRTTRDEER